MSCIPSRSLMQISEDELTLEYLEEKQEGSLLYVRGFVSDNTVVSVFTFTLDPHHRRLKY